MEYLAKPDIRYDAPLSLQTRGTQLTVDRRLARRGGVKRISADVYDSARIALKSYLTDAGGVPLLWRVVLMRG